MLFCDTSTLAKYYVSELESPAVVSRLDAENQVFFSELARAELMGVFHRRLRERKWTIEGFTASVRQFSQDDIACFWTWLPLDQEIIEQTVKTYATLPDQVFLRTADCLHLITALRHRFKVIYTHDVHQMRAASALGLAAVRIE